MQHIGVGQIKFAVVRQRGSQLTGSTPPPHPYSRAARALAYGIKKPDLANLAEHQHFYCGQVPNLHLELQKGGNSVVPKGRRSKEQRGRKEEYILILDHISDRIPDHM